MNIKNKFTKLYNNIKIYKEDDGPTAVYYKDEEYSESFADILNEEDNKFEKKINSAAEKISACRKTNVDLIEYLSERYTLESYEMSEIEINTFKANYIMSYRPYLLKTKEMNITKRGHLSYKEFSEWRKTEERVFDEALNYPMGKLGLNIMGYKFECMLKSGKKAGVILICEDNEDIYSIRLMTENFNDDEIDEINGILNDIILFKGVTQKDIDDRSADFIGYIDALEKRSLL